MSGLVQVPQPTQEIKRLQNPVKELRAYSQFANVEPQLLSKVKIAYVFGRDKTTGLFVTGDDEVYSVGNNQDGRLGIGSELPTDSVTPLKVEALCGKSVSSFNCCSWYGICSALTDSGQIYAWGGNDHSELGLGTTTNTLVPTRIEGLREKRVVQVSAGANHTLALTSEGEVFACGDNDDGQVGNGTTGNQATPVKVLGGKETLRISSVSAGAWHSLAVTTDGEVYAWGCNADGQLGNGTTTNARKPVKISLPANEAIVKICGGQYHTMALGKSGKLYTWGKNDQGQLGNGTNTDSSTPIEIQGLGHVTDIALLNSKYDLSICQTRSMVYIWGTVSGKATIPIETWLTSMQDALCFYSKAQELMYESLHFYPSGQTFPTLASDVAKAFNDQSTCDTKFVSESEGESVHVHRSILEIRSDYFRTMFAGGWKESLETSVKIDTRTSFTSFHALLLFLYTDKIELPHNDLQNIMDLLKLADRYCETRLRKECELILKRGIKVDNAMELFSIASKHNAKELQELAYNYILGHRDEIQFDEELAKHELDLDDFKMLVVGLAKPK